MPGPIAPLATHFVAAEAVPENTALDPNDLRRVIGMVDAAGGVRLGADGYEIEESVLEVLGPGYRQMVAAAVARTNCDPLTTPKNVTFTAAEPPADPAAKINEILQKVGAAVGVVAHVRALIKGATPRPPAWSGPAVDLTPEAAEALAALLGADVNALLALLSPWFPQAAMLLPVTLAAGTALAAWIRKANQAPGVRLELLLWVVPWVEHRTK